MKNTKINTAPSVNLPVVRSVNTKYISTPYIRGASEHTGKLLKEFNIRLSNKSRNTLRSKLSKLKDSIPIQNRTNVVYKINCKNCTKKYIGETGRELNIRLKEHQRNINNLEENSLIYQHARNFGHQFDFTNVEILAHEENVGTRRFLEAGYTVADQNCINRAREIPENFIQIIKNKIN